MTVETQQNSTNQCTSKANIVTLIKRLVQAKLAQTSVCWLVVNLNSTVCFMMSTTKMYRTRMTNFVGSQSTGQVWSHDPSTPPNQLIGKTFSQIAHNRVLFPWRGFVPAIGTKFLLLSFTLVIIASKFSLQQHQFCLFQLVVKTKICSSYLNKPVKLFVKRRRKNHHNLWPFHVSLGLTITIMWLICQICLAAS